MTLPDGSDSSELDCSSDASSESNGKSAYIEYLKQLLAAEESKQKKKKPKANVEINVNAQVEQKDIIPTLLQDSSIADLPLMISSTPDYDD